MTVHLDLDDTRVVIRADEEHRTLLTEIPGVSRNARTQAWKAPRSMATHLALMETFATDLTTTADYDRWLESETGQRVQPATALRETVHLDGTPKLYPFQRAGVAFLSTAERAVLADDLGTGKTRQALLTLRQLHNQGRNPLPALIVCPNATKEAWRREASVVWPDLKVMVVEGPREWRLMQLAEPAHAYVINWEALRFHSSLAPYKRTPTKRCTACGGTDERISVENCEAHPKELDKMRFNSVIGDEIHRAKNPSTGFSRALRASTGNAKFRFGLSGTPIANHPADLWSVMNWVSPEDYPDYDAFVRRFCDVEYSEFGVANIRGVRPERESEFFAILDPRLRRMPKELVLSHLPPVIRVRRDVKQSEKERRAYEQLRIETLAALENSDVLSTPNPMARVTRLLQLASSYATVSGETVRLADPSCKLDAFMRDIGDFSESESVVVFAVSRQLVDMLGERMRRANIDYVRITGDQTSQERQHAIDAFQAGEVRFVLSTIAAGGVGITLTRGSTAVFLQRSWSMVDNEQAEGRVHRIGSEMHDSINVIDYVTVDTLEEVVIQARDRKLDQLERILRDRDILARLVRDNTIEDLERSATQ